MVLKSTDSSEYFDNQPNCFRVHLNKQIHLDGYWSVALTEFGTESWDPVKKTPEVYICCDICEETIVGGRITPLMASFSWRETGKQHYLHVSVLYSRKDWSTTEDLYIYNRQSRQFSFILRRTGERYTSL